MRVAIIHSCFGGFFPRFYANLYTAIKNYGGSCKLFLPNTKTNRLAKTQGKQIYGTRLNVPLHRIWYKITGLQDIFSIFDTFILISKLRKYRPDVIHLHIVNDFYINTPLFFSFCNTYRIPIIWTMHDCRAITGRCAYFDEIGCDKWRSGCGKCPQKILYLPTHIDNSKLQWNIRKQVYQKVKNLTIVTPSYWLADIIANSTLKHIPCYVVHNGIAIEEFGTTQSDFLPTTKRIILSGKHIVLGIASAWEERKGLNTFLKLANDLPDDYQVVLVGKLPIEETKIITIPPTQSLSTLVGIYQSADVFVNPTLADNFPTTNIEALAAGTPVVTYRTGGSAEAIDDTSGIAVPKNDYPALRKAILQIVNNKASYSKKLCQHRAKEFSLKQYDEYVKLYQNLEKNYEHVHIGLHYHGNI